MRGYWLLTLLGILWCLPGATCSDDLKSASSCAVLYPEWYEKINARKAKVEGPKAPNWNGPVTREEIVTERYVPKDFKKSENTVIMLRAPASAEASATTGNAQPTMEVTDKSDARLQDLPSKPVNWKASR